MVYVYVVMLDALLKISSLKYFIAIQYYLSHCYTFTQDGQGCSQEVSKGGSIIVTCTKCVRKILSHTHYAVTVPHVSFYGNSDQ